MQASSAPAGGRLCTSLQRTLALTEGTRELMQEHLGRGPSAGTSVLKAGLRSEQFQVASLRAKHSQEHDLTLLEARRDPSGKKP